MSNLFGERWELVSKWVHSKTEISDQLSVRRVAEIMVDRNIGSLLVVSKSGVQGMITERDILRKVISKGLDPNKVIASDIMTKPLVTINEDATIWDASEIMSQHHIRRLPVKNKNGEITGIITTRTISDALPVITRMSESGEIRSSLNKLKHDE
ncbi:MAG TPA: CBS domain-containing protein [Nitrososphaerales archaeon]